MKLDIVLPRLGGRGGIDRALAALAARVVARHGWEVTVHTTCATSAHTWENDLPAGETRLGDIRVLRHRIDTGRTAAWGPLNDRAMETPDAFDDEQCRAYFSAQGPVSDELAETVIDSDADLTVFAPYLFWTTVAVAPQRSGPTVICPAAHPEPHLRLGLVGSVLARADGLLYGSSAERHLVEHTYGDLRLTRQMTLGWGVEVSEGDPVAAAARFGLDAERGWAICIGRIEYGKGTDDLLGLWRAYRDRQRPSQRLVLVGEVNTELHADPDVVVAADADEATKWGLLRGADVLISPSRLESFGLVLHEAWAAGTPVLADARCQATADHVRHSGGGLVYGGLDEFADAMTRLCNDADLRRRLAAAGEAYRQERYGWPLLTRRFVAFCASVLDTTRR